MMVLLSESTDIIHLCEINMVGLTSKSYMSTCKRDWLEQGLLVLIQIFNLLGLKQTKHSKLFLQA